jgi:PAS domain-containing protein
MWETLMFAAGLGATAVLSVMGGLMILTVLQRPQEDAKKTSIFREGEDATVFLFDGEDLVDATPSAYRLLTGSSYTDKPWFALLERLSARFENLEERLSEVAIAGSVALSGLPREGAQLISLRADLRGGLTKITLVNPSRETESHRGDVLTVHALDSELQELRDVSNAAPFPIWRAVAGGDITWANQAYMELIVKVPRPENVPDWPLRALFDLSHAKGDAKGRPLRRMGPDQSGWFDFKQTLTNTFAELSTGLAVFDHHRKLQLFNPALAKLIDMPVEFLLKRPALFSLLDGMRDRNMLPEPKDYKTWRHQMVALEATSLRGEYNETWHLPNGKAFRVVGRPYPNGALALMVDDITDQVTRDRLSQVELSLAMAVVNQMEDAVVVFSAIGKPLFASASYRKLWGHDPLAMGPQTGAIDVLELWRGLSAPSLVWSEVEAAMSGNTSDIAPQNVRLTDGRLLNCRMIRLPDGGKCLTFRLVTQDQPVADADNNEATPIALSA